MSLNAWVSLFTMKRNGQITYTYLTLNTKIAKATGIMFFNTLSYI